MQNHKALRRVEIKSADEGLVTAVFATLDVVDKDGDLTPKGAFTEGAPVVISAYNHQSWKGALPVGKGVIREVGNEAVFEGQFFLKTSQGRDTFETLKALVEDGPGMEWSYGFDVLDSEPVKAGMNLPAGAKRVLKALKVHEVSPVLIGAGVGTRVTGLKGSDQSFGDELTEVVASVKSVTDRAAEVLAMRQQKGKGLGDESASLVGAIVAELKRLEGLLTEPEPVSQLTEEQRSEMQAAYLRSVSIRQDGGVTNV